jgi:hypothetical protein
MMERAPKNDKFTNKSSLSSENLYRAPAAAPHLPCNGKSIIRQKIYRQVFLPF